VTSSDEAPEGPSRRELNKAATRRAIADAALELLRSAGPGNFTVNDIADKAGISRRTFFNYFSSPEAALTVSTESFLDQAIEQFLSRPADEPLVESMQQALVALADPMHLATMAEVYGLTASNQQMYRFQLEAWDNCSERIIDTISRRPGTSTDPLYISALVGSVLSCGKAAMAEWLRLRGNDVSPESLAVLRQLLIDVIGHLRHGFAR